MTTTAEDIMALAFNASHAETEHSADKWFAQLRTAVERLVKERDALRTLAERASSDIDSLVDYVSEGGSRMLVGALQCCIDSRKTMDDIDAALRGQP